jgi:hypothetical protein
LTLMDASPAPRRRAIGAAAARSAALICCAALAWSCGAQTVSGFKWLDRSGKELAFSQSERRPEGMEGVFDVRSPANRYVLEKSIALEGGTSIAVDVERAPVAAGNGSAGGAAATTTIRVRLGASSEPDGKSPVVESTFPLLEKKARFYLRAKAGSTLACVYAKQEGEGSFRITGISLRPAKAGIEVAEEGTSVSSGFRLAVGPRSRELTIDSPFEGLATGADAGKPGLVIDYGAAAKRPGTGESINIEAARIGGGGVSMSLKLGPGGRRTALGGELIPLDARRIIATAPAGRDVEDFFAATLDPSDYELADLGRVLASQSPADGEDYILYRWDALPSVLVLVFRDYGAQDRYLKRLAFFVEKAGYRGTLQKDEVLGPLHGWNAHDYRPEDLAAFFEKAKEKAFPLSPQERALEKLLVDRDLVREGGGNILPGVGALISISLESPPAQRRLLLVHESTHAIFFADEEYRKYVRQVWASVGGDERWFWKTYFAWAMYDTASDYLMANEFQAYLLQQPIAAAREYFTKRKPEELLEKHPELEQKVEEYMKKYGDSFEARARGLDAWLSDKYGFSAGKTYFLEIGK